MIRELVRREEGWSRRGAGGWLGLLPALIWAALIAFGTGTAARAVEPDDLCTGDPCTIAGDVKLDAANTELDFGSREVVLLSTLDVRDGRLVVNAGRFTISNQGQIRGSGSVLVHAADAIDIGGSVDAPAVRLIGEDGGDLTLTTVTGSIFASRRIQLDSNDPEGDGGSLVAQAGTDATFAGEISAVGGNAGSGGDADLTASGTVDLSGGVNLSGGEFDGGALDVVAGDSIVVGPSTLDGAGDAGDGGDVDLDAEGDIRLNGRLRQRGSADECGDGGDLGVQAGHEVEIAAEVDLSARTGDCSGGSADVTGGTVRLAAPVLLDGPSNAGSGGSFSIASDGDVECTSSVDFGGSTAGDLDFEALRDIGLAASCALDGSGPGGQVDLEAAGVLEIAGTIQVGRSAGGSIVPAGIDGAGCSVRLLEAGVLRSLGQGSRNVLTAATELLVAGTMSAVEANQLRVVGDLVPVVTGNVTPPAELVPEAGMGPCREPPTPSPTRTITFTPTLTPVPTMTATGTATATAAATATPAATESPTSVPPATETATRAATPTLQPVACTGDCDENGSVSVDDLVTGVRIGLRVESLVRCPSIDTDASGGADIRELVEAATNSMRGCP